MIDTATRDACWLHMVIDGRTTAEIAEASGVTARTVQYGIRRAVEANGTPSTELPKHKPLGVPSLVPVFPIPALTPASACPHRGTIRKKSRIVCAVCWKSGWDHHPDLFVPKHERPKPPKATAQATAKKGVVVVGKETRRQRRARIYGEKQTA